jgi:SAM-dependent methyltransferase
VPVHQHSLLSSRQAARSLTRGALGMRACNVCGFVFNGQFDPTLLDYGASYDNTQSCSPAFDRYLDETVQHLIHERDVRQARIVEVGCGKGTFLRKLVADPTANNQAVGFDPSYLGAESEFDGRLRFVTRFFDGTGLTAAPNVVLCRHVIEHIERPVEFLQTIDAALQATGSTSARVFFETPCIEWILRNQVVWDFFYEHCSLFSATSLAATFRGAGFDVRKVTHLFGGQYLWLEANWTRDAMQPAGTADTAAEPGPVPQLAAQFATAESAQLAAWTEQTRRLRRQGRVALWGGGAKGVTFANLVDPAAELISAVVDVNPQKQGKFLPGTGHPLIAPAELDSLGISSALVLNSNYINEIRATLRQSGSPVTAIDLMAPLECQALS